MTLVAIRPFAREKKRFAQKFTDGRTDGQTTDAARLYKLMEWANEGGEEFKEFILYKNTTTCD